jgi:hypothetical protein
MQNTCGFKRHKWKQIRRASIRAIDLLSDRRETVQVDFRFPAAFGLAENNISLGD